jgi:hypothetical protein
MASWGKAMVPSTFFYYAKYPMRNTRKIDIETLVGKELWERHLQNYDENN